MKTKDYRYMLFDFDGVILDSAPIRENGFRDTLKDHQELYVNQLVDYHVENGGLSRYVKFRYFYEQILGRQVSDATVQRLARQFSEIMRQNLVDKKLLIPDTLNFIKINHTKIPMHIVSGSDQEELLYLCEELGISRYFLSINGSPIPKKELVKQVLSKYSYTPSETLLIGDSINDYEAARDNDVDFYGYNNEDLKNISKVYVNAFKQLSK